MSNVTSIISREKNE